MISISFRLDGMAALVMGASCGIDVVDLMEMARHCATEGEAEGMVAHAHTAKRRIERYQPQLGRSVASPVKEMRYA